jgi:hypothetical protein
LVPDPLGCRQSKAAARGCPKISAKGRDFVYVIGDHRRGRADSGRGGRISTGNQLWRELADSEKARGRKSKASKLIEAAFVASGFTAEFQEIKSEPFRRTRLGFGRADKEARERTTRESLRRGLPFSSRNSGDSVVTTESWCKRVQGEIVR